MNSRRKLRWDGPKTWGVLVGVGVQKELRAEWDLGKIQLIKIVGEKHLKKV